MVNDITNTDKSDNLIKIKVEETPHNISKIPKGAYCQKILKVEGGRLNIEPCPYLHFATDKDEQVNGYCSLMGHGDWMGDSFSLLWDSVKECNHYTTEYLWEGEGFYDVYGCFRHFHPKRVDKHEIIYFYDKESWIDFINTNYGDYYE